MKGDRENLLYLSHHANIACLAIAQSQDFVLLLPMDLASFKMVSSLHHYITGFLLYKLGALGEMGLKEIQL